MREFEQTTAADLRVGDTFKVGRRTVVARKVNRLNAVGSSAEGISVGFNAVDREGRVSSRDGWTTLLLTDLVHRAIPSDQAATVAAVPKSNPNQKEATMATITRKKASSAKPAVKKTAAKPAAKPTAKAPAKTRRTAEDVAALVPEFVEHLTSGGKMKDLKAEHGFSDDGPIRRALYFAGYDSKGAEHGVEAGSVDASKVAGKKQLAALRAEGAGWYVLEYVSGLSTSEVKAIVEDQGGATSGRVYRERVEKPTAAAKPASKPSAEATAATKRGSTKRGRAVKADPSSEA